MPSTEYKYLNDIDSPDDLKKLPVESLPEFCCELRDFIIKQLSENPGHLASNLGTVELTAALHYVYDTPEDKLVWDVGHQAYAHKIITGRRSRFHTNRKMGGISGFPSRDESPYDAFGGGHTSVSISAALGIAKALELQGEKHRVVAVIGDGAMTGGLAFEGLNNAGVSRQTDLLVILNDNRMSIDPNVGALKEKLLRMSTSRRYNDFKTRLWAYLAPRAPRLLRIIRKLGNAVKHSLLDSGNIFESLQFRYFGPVDGHDIKTLVSVLNDLKEIPGPKLLHVLTVKGKGYPEAEHNQTLWHAPGRFDADTGERLGTPAASAADRWQDVFGETVVELAEMNPAVVGITPAMPTGCSLNTMMQRMPDRCFDVGIAEGHAVTFSAGLAAQGMVPFCNIYSSFMQRAYDNVIHDVAIQRLGVVLCLDRAGLVGEDGQTHQGEFDLAYLGCIPHMTVAVPMDEHELRNMMYTAMNARTPFAIRYPRGKGPGAAWRDTPFENLAIGRGRCLREGDRIALLTFGHVGNFAASAARRAAEQNGLSVAHYDMRFAKPLDEELLHRVGRRFRQVITVEDGILRGGAGSAVLDFLNLNGYDCRVTSLGIDDAFVKHGSLSQLYALCGYDAEGIYQAILNAVHDEKE